MSNGVKWTIYIVAAIGFLFDIYSVLVGPLILQPALLELGGFKPGTPEYRDWAANLFWIPPLFGGFFGLVGGYLTDLLGRRRVLVWSIMLYTLSSVAAGYSTTLPALLVWRTLSFIGLCVEFVAAVAWLAELFTEPKQRERVLGWTQAFASLGGVLVSQASYLSNHYALSLPAIYGTHAAWRYTLISAVLPAIPLAIIRPFLPESPECSGNATPEPSSARISPNSSSPPIAKRPLSPRCCSAALTERRSDRSSSRRKSRPG
jgi:MFS family permease